jgi:glycosidase
VINGDVSELKQIATFQMTWIGMPEIYYGDEAGLTGAGEDPLRRHFFPWSHPNTSLQDFYAKLIHIREANPAFSDGSVAPLVTHDGARVLAYLRTDSTQTAAVAINDDPAASHFVSLTIKGFTGRLTDELSGQVYDVPASGTIGVTIGPRSAAILVSSPSAVARTRLSNQTSNAR